MKIENIQHYHHNQWWEQNQRPNQRAQTVSYNVAIDSRRLFHARDLLQVPGTRVR